jgi:hypothetical protein
MEDRDASQADALHKTKHNQDASIQDKFNITEPKESNESRISDSIIT